MCSLSKSGQLSVQRVALEVFEGAILNQVNNCAQILAIRALVLDLVQVCEEVPVFDAK